MACRWALLVLLVALLAPCPAVGSRAAMEALQAAWAPQGWDLAQAFCDWPGVVCNANQNATEIDLKGLPKVGGVIPVEIGDLSSLQHLSLAGNLLYGTVPSQIGQLMQLSYLDLSDNDLSGSVPAVLASTPLTYLNLSYNFFAGDVPSSVLDLASLANCDFSSNSLANCSAGTVSSTATCDVSCGSDIQPKFTGPCGASPLLSPSIISNCTNGTGYVTIVRDIQVAGSWFISEPVMLTLNASVMLLGSLFLESPSNLYLAAPLIVSGTVTLFPGSNTTFNMSKQVDTWISANGCLQLEGALIFDLETAPPKRLAVNVSSSSCFLTGFQSVSLQKGYKDNACFTSQVQNNELKYTSPYLQVFLKDKDCATREKRRLIIFGAVFGGIGVLVTLCIVISLGCIRQKQRREGLLIDDQL